MQFGLAGTIAAHGIDVHARLDHVGGENGGVGLVGRHRGHDIHALDGGGDAAEAAQAQARHVGQIARQLVAGGGIDVVEVQRVDAQDVVKRQRLEFALRAVADQGHAARTRTGQGARGQRRGGGGAQRGGQGQFADQQRFAGVDLRQRAKGHHGAQAGRRIAGVAVDVLEAVEIMVGGGHQLDHAGRRMIGDARALVELRPAQEIGQQIIQQVLEYLARALCGHDLRNVCGGEQCRHCFPLMIRYRNSVRCPGQCLAPTFHTKCKEPAILATALVTCRKAAAKDGAWSAPAVRPRPARRAVRPAGARA
jgi:hypothetical protein